jgi:glycosyltransferase involved in cell wall biosynthesis
VTRLRVAFVLPRISQRPVGALKVIYEHADRLAGKGHRVTLLHPAGQTVTGADPHPWYRFRNRDVRSIVVPVPAEKLIPGHFDVVVATSWQVVPAVHALPARFGRKVYFLQDHESYLLGDAPIREAMARTFTVPWPLIVNSEPVHRLVATVAGRDCHRIPCVIDTAAFRLDIPTDSTERQLIGFPARPEQAKRTEDAVTAVDLVRSRLDQGQQLDVWCFGSYPRAGLPGWITHYSASDDRELRHLYNRTAVFIVPSLHEGFGLPGAEAMACGAALVSTRNGGVDAYATHGESALLCPVKNPEALAAATIKLLTDPALRHRLARAGASQAASQRPVHATDAFEAVLCQAASHTGNHDQLPGSYVDCL